MDWTLLREETASKYIRYQREIGEASSLDLARVLWWVLLYTFNLIDAPKVATRALAGLDGCWETVLASRCDDWMRRDVLHSICDDGRRAVQYHHAQGDFVALATGATVYSARPLARELGIEHMVATELEVVDGKLTGRVRPPLSYGRGKLQKASNLLEAHGLSLANATFYSDSITDRPLLEAVEEAVAVNPDPGLLRLARTKGWRIVRW